VPVARQRSSGAGGASSLKTRARQLTWHYAAWLALLASGRRGPSHGSFRQVVGAKIYSHPWDCCQLGVVKKESFELRA